jgi:hypothetical protein
MAASAGRDQEERLATADPALTLKLKRPDYTKRVRSVRHTHRCPTVLLLLMAAG